MIELKLLTSQLYGTLFTYVYQKITLKQGEYTARFNHMYKEESKYDERFN